MPGIFAEWPGGPTEIIPAFRINGTNGMQSGVHGERARLACRAVRPARHTGRPQAFGTPWVATCIPRGRGIRHARRVRSPNHASLHFQPLFPVSLFLKDRIISVGPPGHSKKMPGFKNRLHYLLSRPIPPPGAGRETSASARRAFWPSSSAGKISAARKGSGRASRDRSSRPMRGCSPARR